MKEKLPIDFITNFVSKGWETVGDLKASVEAIKKEFTDTKMVADIIQDLIDAYLIALGQMELHLDKKDYLDIPEEKALKESLELQEAKDKFKPWEENIEDLDYIDGTNTSSISKYIKDNKLSIKKARIAKVLDEDEGICVVELKDEKGNIIDKVIFNATDGKVKKFNKSLKEDTTRISDNINELKDDINVVNDDLNGIADAVDVVKDNINEITDLLNTTEDISNDKKDEKDKDLPDEPFEYFVDFDDAELTDAEAEDIASYRKGL